MKRTKQVQIGRDVSIGGKSPIAVQSMTTTDTKMVRQTVEQIHALEQAGCEIVRCAIADEACALAVKDIRDQIDIPLVADVHFDYQLAVLAIENGADKIRINPGNIGGKAEILKVVSAAKTHHIPIRVGANAGSLAKDLLEQFGGPTEDALVESAMRNVRTLEDANFTDIVISIKSSSAPVCIRANRIISKLIEYPLHLGVTEAGTYQTAMIKSAIGLGALLVDGIGDTLRVSITGDPVQEVFAANDILKHSGIKKGGVEIISCPTCGRCTLDIEKIASNIEQFTRNIKIPLTVAVMGCAVNGPGEAREADIGVAGGRGNGLLFANGEVIRKVDDFDIIPELKRLILEYQKNYEHRNNG